MHENPADELPLENDIGEELHGNWTDADVFQMTRHPANYNTEKVWEWIEEMTEKKAYPCIWIVGPTIG